MLKQFRLADDDRKRSANSWSILYVIPRIWKRIHSWIAPL